MKLIVKGWASFQHYKDRSPPWIKLHKTLLDNFEYQSLPLASRALAPMLWLLASEQIDGSIDADPRKLAFRLRTSVDEVVAGLNPLIENGFFIGDSIPLADCKQSAIPETEPETYKPETEPETYKPETEPETREKNNRATRLTQNALLSEEWINEALKIRADWSAKHVQAVFDEFKDYWIARPGKDAAKLDWIATWRNWCRREKGFNNSASNPKKTRFEQIQENNRKAGEEFVNGSDNYQGQTVEGEVINA